MFVATNLADLHAEPSFLSELLTQVTNGVELKVLDEREKWCRVQQADGYEGWTFKPFLVDGPLLRATHIARKTLDVFPEPHANRPVTRIPIGTALLVEEMQDRWSYVATCAGTMIPKGWIDPSELRPTNALPLGIENARREIVDVARSLTGTYYLWGGCSDWGIDCSGLAQLCHRLVGYAIPRDARLQFPAARKVEPPFKAADLLFFAGDATDPKRITHVGISTGEAEGWNIIHSSRGRNGVYEEGVQASESLRRGFVGGGTFLPES